MPEVTFNDQPVPIKQRKAMAILAYMAVHNQPTSRDRLSHLLWVNADDARTNLRGALYHIRKQIGVEIFETGYHTIQFHADIAVVCDVQDNEATLSLSRVENETLLVIANALGKPFMEGFLWDDGGDFDHWLMTQRDHYASLHVQLQERIARQYQRAGEYENALQHAQHALHLNPLNEPVVRMLMRLYIQLKQRDLAIEQYLSLVKNLREELGLDPNIATRKLYDDILAIDVLPEDTDPLLLQQASMALFPPVPEALIGRDELVDAITDGLKSQHAVVALFGMAGIGKTALAATVANEASILQTFSDGVLWVSLGNNPDIEKILKMWTLAMGMPAFNDAEINQHKIRHFLRDRRLLLIIDDVRQSQDIQPFLLGGADCAVLVTTRYRHIAEALHPMVQIIDTPPMIKSDAFNLLSRLVASDFVAEHDELVQQVVSKFGEHPQALMLIGKQLKKQWQLGLGERFLSRLIQGLDVDTLLDMPISDMYNLQNETVETLRQQLEQTLNHYRDAEILTHLEHLSPVFTIEDWLTQNATDDTSELEKIINIGVVRIMQPGHFSINPIWMLYLASTD